MQIQEIFKKYKMLIIAISIIFICYLIYLVIIWLRTESTDNAYVKSEISYLAANVTGYVKVINFEENDIVKKNDVLMIIDDVTYQAAFKKAEANLLSAESTLVVNQKQQQTNRDSIIKLQADIRSAKSALDTSNSAYKRILKLYDNKNVAKAQLEQGDSAYQAANANHASAQYALTAAEDAFEELKAQEEQVMASISASKADLLQAKYNLDNTKIIAPFDGQAGRRLCPLGQLVMNGTYITNLVSNDRWIIANYKETQLAKIKVGQDVDIKIDTYDGVVFKGRVESIAPASGSEFSLLPPDNATGNFTKIVQRIPIKITFNDKEMIKNYDLIPGMSVKTIIKTGF